MVLMGLSLSEFSWLADSEIGRGDSNAGKRKRRGEGKGKREREGVCRGGAAVSIWPGVCTSERRIGKHA